MTRSAEAHEPRLFIELIARAAFWDNAVCLRGRRRLGTQAYRLHPKHNPHSTKITLILNSRKCYAFHFLLLWNFISQECSKRLNAW